MVAYPELANLQRMLGDLAGAERTCREGLERVPGHPQVLLGLGPVLLDRRDLEGAEAAYADAARGAPNDGGARYALALALMRRGKHAEALRAYETSEKLARPGSPLVETASLGAREAARRLALEPRLDGLISGADVPKSLEQSLDVVGMCEARGAYARAAALFLRSFQDPSVVVMAGAFHRAATSAALAASGAGSDAPSLDEAARGRWRTQAIEWLRLTLRRIDEERTARPRLETLHAITRLRLDPALSSLREPEALASLPVAERKALVEFWAEVETHEARTRKAR
jgi:Flp pilus assembly protein TadD